MMDGRAILFSAPSGSGKTTIVRELMRRFPQLGFSVSATTRNRRDGETDGRDYHFLSAEDFKARVDRNEFIEWEQVYDGLFYGTLKSEVERLWQQGKDVIFDVDVKGGLALKAYFGPKVLAVFVAVPSLEELHRRLQRRGTETEESLAKRLAKAEFESGFSKDFDVVVVNDRIDRAVEEAGAAYLQFRNAHV